MTKIKPAYFSLIKNEANQRWEQLENYPDLAAPWHQLFRQIQSPRHVISELLQNADDVGATWASVSIQDDHFIFKHNGVDFNEENFHSLCRFGYSNKRKLHTIGFRGIGFKSTFSLGPRVEINSPTLSVAFQKERFTEPVWQKLEWENDDGITAIRVKIEASGIQQFIKENIRNWIKNPLPLLFFQSIKCISLDNQQISKEILSKGPVKNSIWVSLESKEKRRLLLVSSKEEGVPRDALDEIREERGDHEFVVPPCRVELVLGSEMQQFYEILPTGVTIKLPFSANAPFIQDPARTGIKDPLQSPMNSWLIQRIGKLVSSTFTNWLSNTTISLQERAKAYTLLPHIPENNANSISGYCEKVIIDIFREQLDDKPILLTHQGELALSEKCLNIDSALLEVWTDDQLVEIFGVNQNAIIAKEVSSSTRKLLNHWELLERMAPSDILNRLTQDPLPLKPELNGIKTLWIYVNEHLPNWSSRYWQKENLRIVPVKSKQVLYPPKGVNVLSIKEKQLTDEEFAFLQNHLNILDSEWLKYIQNIKNQIAEQSQLTDKQLLALSDLFSELKLDQGITIESIFRLASEEIFSIANPGEKGIRIAQIASRLDIAVPDKFKFLCQDGKWQDISFGILLPDNVLLETLYSEKILKAHLISNEYEKGFSKDLIIKWHTWLQSYKSKLRKILPPKEINHSLYSKPEVSKFCQHRNAEPPTEYPRKSNQFYVTDYDFSNELWNEWVTLSISEPNIWTYLVRQIAEDWQKDWEDASYAKIQQETHSYLHTLNHGLIYASWVEKLKQCKCIPDTYSKPRYPSELLRNTPETSPLLRVESFVHSDYDQPRFSILLDLLGVRNKPTDTTKILDRIRSITTINLDSKILQQITNLFDALDRVILLMTSDQIEAIKQIFELEDLILSEDLTLHKSPAIYQMNPDQIPGLPSIHSVVANLNLWDRLGILKAPSVDDAINWLNQLPWEGKLPTDERERARAIIQRYPDRVWLGCCHWFNLEGEWCPCQDLTLATEKPFQGDYLFSWVKKTTADLSMLENPELLLHLGNLTRLENVLEYRISNYKISRHIPNPEWISATARSLGRLKLRKDTQRHTTDKLDIENIRTCAKRLLETRLMYVRSLQAAPYIQGQAAGYLSSVKAQWYVTFLYVVDDQINHHREIVNTVSSFIKDACIREAINDCVEREEAWIKSYFNAYYELDDSSTIAITPEENIDKNVKLGIGEIGPSDIKNPDEDHEYGFEILLDSDRKDESDDEFETRKKRKKTLRPYEKFALFIQSDQFIWQPNSKYFMDKKGAKVVYDQGVFPWIQFESTGIESCRFCMVEGTLDKGILIRAEILDLMKHMPDTYCLVIQNGTSYQKVFWKDIDQLLLKKRLIISPAAYLVRHINEDDLD